MLDIAGCEKLFGSPEKIAHDLKRVASEVGLETNVAVAGSPLAAVCAAQGFAGVTVIPAGEEGLRIGRLSLEALRIPFEFVETLKRWGKTHLRGFCGPSRNCDCRAAGTGRAPLVAFGTGRGRSTADRQRVSLEFRRAHGPGLSGGIAGAIAFRSESTSRTVVRAAAYAHSRHRRDQSYAHARTQRLTHKGTNSFTSRTIRLPVPARDSKLLLKLLQLDLEKHPPSLPVTAVRMLAIPVKPRAQQLGLFLPLSPDPERLEITLARIQSTVGENRVGAPVLLDTHSPNAFQQNRFVLPEMKEKRQVTERQTTAAMRIFRPPLPATR